MNFGLALVQGLACDFFQLNSNSSGRNSPKGTFFCSRFELRFAWCGSSTRRLLQTSINALPTIRPGQVPVPDDQCFASERGSEEPSVRLLRKTAVETHSDRHRSIQYVWLTAFIDEQVPSTASSYSAVFDAVQLTMGYRTPRIRVLNLDKALTSIS